jgi:S1-C subfamily serine protease
MGRIGLDYYRKDPKVVFAIIDTEKVGSGRPPAKAYLGITGEDAPGGALIQSVSDNSPAAKGGLKAG